MSSPFQSDRERISLRDIAKELGLSHSTISLSLRNHPRISAAIREKVQEKARLMGYRPDPMLTALAQYRNTKTVQPIHACIAWVNTWERPEELRRYHQFNAYWLGAEKAAQRLGYRLEEFVVNEQMPLHRLEKIFLTRNIHGLLLPPLRAPSPLLLSDLNWDLFSVVRFGRSWGNLGFNSVTADRVGNTVLAFQKMAEKGYRRIGFVGDPDRRWLSGAGFLWAQIDLPEGDRVPPFFFPQAHYEEHREGLRKWLETYRPDAILTEKAELPERLHELGYRVPEDIGLAATTVVDCPISAGIDTNPEEIGRVGMLGLISLINDNATGVPPISRDMLIRGRWVDGGSLGAEEKAET